MKKEFFDVLFVITQDVDFQQVTGVIRKKQYTSVLVLSTHFLLPSEVKQLQKLLPNTHLKIVSFGDFLTEEKMLEIDATAFEKFKSSTSINPETAYRFLEELVYFKNKAIHKELRQKMSVGKIYFFATPWIRVNLGVSYKYWKIQNGTNLTSFSYFWKKRLGRFLQKNSIGQFSKNAILYFKMLAQPRTAWILKWEKKYFIFHSLKRLRFEGEQKMEEIKYRSIQFFHPFKSNSRTQIFSRFLKKQKLGDEVFLATPLHQFSHFYNFVDRPILPILIFVDGYRPSNYPPYAYIDYFPFGDFVSRDQFDFKLATTSNRKALQPFPFLKKSHFEIPKINTDLNTNVIILSLNHAGDWTSMINRTDTDKLIFSFCKISQEYKDKKFIIRLHPTMALPRHEGKNSKTRIEKLIEEMNLPNLTTSKVSLEDDWARGDIFVSEYSLSALDAMRFGKISLFVNLTRRRSFVQDFVDLGFPIANGEDAFFSKIKDMIDNPIIYQKQQIEAAKQYNKDLNTFLEK